MTLAALSPLVSWLVFLSLFVIPGAIALALVRPRARDTEFPRPPLGNELTDDERAALEPYRLIRRGPYDWRDEDKPVPF